MVKSFALSSFEGASNTRNCVVVTLLFTENCTEETRKSKQGRYCELMYTIFSTLKDFPKQIRIKRKYLTERDKFRFDVGSALKIPLDARKPTET